MEGEARGELIEAHCDGLAQVHRRLTGIGGNLDKQMAAGEILAGKAALFRAKDERYAPATLDLPAQDRGEAGERHNGLFRLAPRERCGAGDKRAIGHGFGQTRSALRVMKEFAGSNC
jgi:hypothetical protein